MQWPTVILVFAVVWWLVFFIVLPFGQVSQAEAGYVEPGTVASAPANINLKRKSLITSCVAILLTIAIYFVLTYDLLGFNVENSGL
jgi:predicted secreted protein